MRIQRISLLAGAVWLMGCTVAPDYAEFRCDPDEIPELRPARCQDAGVDASDPDGGAVDGGPDAIAPQAACPGRCVPYPGGIDGIFWSRWPDSLWVGLRGDKPADCPAGSGFVKQLDRVTDLDAPPAVCDVCECEPSTGECAGLPSDIHINAGACYSGAQTVPFGGPAGWDGTCTDANALAQGAKCPAGSNTLCAQSITVDGLSGPIDESCAVTSHPVPAAHIWTDWKQAGVSCRGDIDETLCGEGAACVGDLGLPWLQCVWRAGVHAVCPPEYDWDRFVLYPEDAIIEGRQCTGCECGAPEGSACVGTIRLYDDSFCGSQFAEYPFSSIKETCLDISLPGRAIGAKAITDIGYVPGVCEASGGESIGEAYADDTQATTFCCLRPFFATQ